MRADVGPLDWELRAAHPESATLLIAVEVHEFLAVQRVEVEESPDSVAIAVSGLLEAPAGGWTTYGRKEEHAVELAAPLGHRSVGARG